MHYHHMAKSKVESVARGHGRGQHEWRRQRRMMSAILALGLLALLMAGWPSMFSPPLEHAGEVLLSSTMMCKLALWALPLAFTTAFCQSPPHPGNTGNGTSFLDHDALVSAYPGQTFLKENIPFIDIPDSLIQDVYYYRWTAIQRQLRYIIAGTGYMATEFMQPVGYAKVFGSIDAAAGHQIDESRWLRSTFYADDYIQLYTRGPGDSKQYTNWILDAANRRTLVTGDASFLSTQLDDLVRMWHLWDDVFDENAGLYYYTPNWDAQEYSLPGFVADANGTDPDLRREGPDTFRPNHNAYMVANARSIARAADLAGNRSVRDQFLQTADELEAAIFKVLWAPEQQFFMDVIRPGNPKLTRLTGREEVGLFPFRFNIGLNKSYAQPALDAMFDPQGFLTEYGPPTLEVRDPWFMPERPDGYCCYWNGQSWPFSTAHTLKSLAAIYRSNTTNATAENYLQYLETYARTQHKNGVPYVAESHYPLRDAWSSDSSNHSESYDHSTNNDDVITGLLGIIPQADNSLVIDPIMPDNWTYFALENLPYHGHLVTVLYDQDGSRYKQGKGLKVFIDGKPAYNGKSKYATVSVPPPPSAGTTLVNIAANPAGLGAYPKADATYTNAPMDWTYEAIDGRLFYDDIPNNRWTNFLSPNDNDTFTVTFARPRKMSSVTLALYSDVAFGRSVDVPSSIEIYGSNGLITTVTGTSKFLANDRTQITFPETETLFLSLNMYRQTPSLYVGICELEVWVEPNPGPTYYAVDAYLEGGPQVSFDGASTATGNGAIVQGLVSGGTVAFSGIVSDGGSATLTLSYANNGTSKVDVDVLVNQATQATLTLQPSGENYTTVSAGITLGKGKNYITLSGGAADVNLETLKLS